MKKKVMGGIAAALLAVAAGSWLIGGREAGRAHIPREILLEDPEQRDLILELTARIVELYNRKGEKGLARSFDFQPHERLLAKAEHGEDPVEASLAVLRRRGEKLSLLSPEVKTWHIGAANLYFVDCRLTEDSDPVRLLLIRKQGRFLLKSIQEL